MAEKEAEARGGAADVAINPSSYDFERRFDDQTIELRDQCHMLQTDKVGLQPACNRPATGMRPPAPSLQPHASSLQPHASSLQARVQPAAACVQPAPLLLATYLTTCD